MPPFFKTYPIKFIPILINEVNCIICTKVYNALGSNNLGNNLYRGHYEFFYGGIYININLIKLCTNQLP